MTGLTFAASPVAALAISGDGLTAAAGYSHHSGILLFDLFSGLPLRRLEGHRRPVSFLHFDARNNRLISANAEEVIFWSLPDFRQERRLELALRPQREEAGADSRFLYDPARELLFRSVGQEVLCYSLRREGLGKRWEGKTRGRKQDAVFELALAPEAEDLLVLDAGSGQVHRIDLEYFRERDKVEVPGAGAMAAGNRQFAVVGRHPDSARYQIRLFSLQLEPLGSHSLPADFTLASAGSIRLAFTGRGLVSTTAAGGLIDLNLETGIAKPYSFNRFFEELIYHPDGRLFLLRGATLEVIDNQGRLSAQLSLLPGHFLLAGPGQDDHLLLRSDSLLDGRGVLRRRLAPEDADPFAADLRDGELVVAGPTGRIAVYDLDGAEAPRRLEWKGRPLSRLVAAPAAGRIAAFSARDTAAWLLDAGTGAIVARLRPDRGRVTALALDGDRWLVGDSEGGVSLFRVADGGWQGSRRLLHGPVFALATVPGGRLVGGREGVALFSGKENPVRRYRGHDNAVRELAVAAAGDRFLSLAGDDVVLVWEAATGRLLQRLSAADAVRQAVFKAGGQEVALVTGSGKPAVFPSFLPDPAITEADDSRSRLALRGGIPGEAVAPAFNSGGSLLAAPDPLTRKIRIRETRTGKTTQMITPAGNGKIGYLSFLDDQEVLIAGAGGGLEYWDPRTGCLLKQVDYRGAGFSFVEVVKEPGREALWAIGADSDQVVCLEANTGDVALAFRVSAMKGPEEKLSDLALAEGRLAVAGREGIYVYGTADGKPVAHIPVPSPTGMTLSPDGRLLAYLRPDRREVYVYDLALDKLSFRAPGNGAAFLDDLRLGVVWTDPSRTNLLDLWDCLKAAPVATLDRCHQERAVAAALHVQAGLAAAAGPAGEISFWKMTVSPSGEFKFAHLPEAPVVPVFHLLLARQLLSGDGGGRNP